MPEEGEATPIAARPTEGERPPVEAAPDGAEGRNVTAPAAEAVWVEGAQFAAPKKHSALLPLAIGIAALLILIGGAGWWFVNADRPAADASKAAAEAARLSLVVLPFTNLSNDPIQDYFADGVTENLTTELSRLHNSFVIARNTAFTFKGKNLDAKAIGRELGVRYVLEGSCSATPTACASTPSSLTPKAARIFGRIDSTKTWPSCSSSRMKWSRASPARFR
jgi:hypothetical protein